jgi:mRNA interferase RelE/StbE
MPYQVLIVKSAAKEIRALPKTDIPEILNKIRQLEDNPRPIGCKKLVNSKNKWRIKSGNYRIIYSIDDEIITVTVVRVAHRKDVYD